MKWRIVIGLIVLGVLLPLIAGAEPSPPAAGESEAKLQQRIKELDAYAKSLEKRVTDLARRNDELERRLNERWPQFRLVVPPGTLPYGQPPLTPPSPAPFFEAPSTLPPGQPGWQPRNSGNTSHYLIPTEQSIVPGN
jgi:hypothetical protein